MPSPDLSAYTSLTLYDKTPSDLVERALLDAAAKLPGWVPRDGNTEVVLMEALALSGAEMVYALNRVPDAVMEILLKIYGVTRDLGTPPTATVTFTTADTTGYTIPAGTTVRLTVGADTLDFTLNSPVAVAAGSTTGTGAVTATRSTSTANGVAAGTELALVSPIPAISTAVLASAVTAGADPETDVEWRDRGVQRLGRLVSTLVTPRHFELYALENPLVYRARGIDNYDGTATNAGHVTVAVLGSGGAVLSAGAKTSLQTEMDALAQANLAVHVVDATITAVAVTATVKARTGYDTPTVTANVTAALDAFLSPDTWEWGATVRHNDLIAVIDGAVGVDYVVSLTVPAGDATLSGAAPLADLGTLTLTVT